jgi:hypothetical protein
MEGIIQRIPEMRNKEYLYTLRIKVKKDTFICHHSDTQWNCISPSIARRSGQANPFTDEIIVADAGSKMVLQNWRNQGRTLCARWNAAVGRNAGARAAKGISSYFSMRMYCTAWLYCPCFRGIWTKKTGRGDMLYRATRWKPFGWNDLCGYKLYFQIYPTVFPSCSGFCILSNVPPTKKWVDSMNRLH